MGKEIKIRIKVPSFNVWKVSTFVLLALFLISLYGNISGFLTGKITLLPFSDQEKIKKNTIDFINQHLVSPGTKAEVISITDKGSYYEILTLYQGNRIPVYVSKDGKLLFLNVINMEEWDKFEKEEAMRQTQNVENVPKRDKPEFRVFIMSYCPFGIQAVKALLPVMKLLGDKADITVHYVNYIMHGEKEVWENLREYCIQRDQKSKFYDYMLCFVQNDEYEKCVEEAKVDVNLLQSCMDELDKKYNLTGILQDKSKWYNGRFPPFPIEDELNEKYNVRGSPTIIINDVEVRLNRSPEAFKQALCNAFINPPEECNVKLSEEIAAPGIGPLSGGTNTQASCG